MTKKVLAMFDTNASSNNYSPVENTTTNPRTNSLDNTRTKCSHIPKDTTAKGQGILHKRKLKKVLIEIFGKNSKYADCLKWANSSTGGVQIVKNQKTGSINWSGRWRCKDRGCPVCAIVREQKNAEKIKQILHHPDNDKSTVLFITLTQERLKQSLTEGLKTQSKMRSELNRSLMKQKKWGFQGFITAVEFTYRLYDGAVHPHAHLAGMFDIKLIKEMNSHKTVEEVITEIQAYIVDRWVQLAEKHGVYATKEAQKVIIVKNMNREALGAYLLKFAQELASGSTKEARVRGVYTYAGLLNRYAENKCEATARAIRQINKEIKYKRTFIVAKNLKPYLEEEDFEVDEADVIVSVPLRVFGQLAKHKVQDHIMLMYNGWFHKENFAYDMEQIFEKLCEIYSSGWANSETDNALKAFCEKLQTIKI